MFGRKARKIKQLEAEAATLKQLIDNSTKNMHKMKDILGCGFGDNVFEMASRTVDGWKSANKELALIDIRLAAKPVKKATKRKKK